MAEDNSAGPIRVRHGAAGALAVPAPFAALLRWPGFDPRGVLAAALVREVEQRRPFVLLPVAFGAGILIAFEAEGRPGLAAPLVAALAAVVLAVAARRHFATFAVLLGTAFLFSGFAATVLRRQSVEAPVLARTLIAPLAGFVEAIEERPRGARLTVRVASLGEVGQAERPRRVRVSVRDARGLSPGDFVTAKARLSPPPQPAWPGGYDFARDAFFRAIGAVGSVLGRAVVAPAPDPASFGLRVAAAVDRARNALTVRIADAIGGQAGAVAAALVTGKRGLIAEETNDVLRGAGIYHIVSISGLHMVLAAGTLFFLARALLSLSATAALNWPIKKIAAVIAMAGACAYCIFSGSEVATERSLVMTLVMLGAILVDRPALSMRNLAVAALIVLAREPESLLGPSFQMSFSAVAALTAMAPLLAPRRGGEVPRGPLSRAARAILRSLVGLLLTTAVAGVATAPFSAFHFQTLNPLGLVGNALALPLVSLVVMPAAVLGVVALPFGLDGIVWRVMGLAVEKVLAVSGFVSGLDGATVLIPALGLGAIAALAAALLLATLPASRLRWLALAPAALGLALAADPVRYDAFVDREGLGAAVRGRDGRLVLLGKPSAFVVEQWLRADGDGRGAKEGSLRESVRCDRAGCVTATAAGGAAAYVADVAAFEEDCRRAALVISRLAAPPTCKPRLLLDRAALAARGAVALRFEVDAVLLHSAGRGGEGERRSRSERIAPPPLAPRSPAVADRPPPRPTIDLPDAGDPPDGDDPLSSDEPG